MTLDTRTTGVSITFPNWLLELLDLVCELNGYSRAGFVSVAVKKRLVDMASDNPRFLQKLYDHYIEESS